MLLSRFANALVIALLMFIELSLKSRAYYLCTKHYSQTGLVIVLQYHHHIRKSWAHFAELRNRFR